ncbi:Uncharacterized protein LHYA1_G006167 [Lachnellula hyalina]|uniref:Inhibitor I9 domain-containing protein n=1 Tax=Lachnellula hyalina TaxID=1316788 RepID=A0A8H8QXB6_9HELO|nr:Uncharacterized protein LHYA1_G006167 [Lachnellula hyalina]TVY23870.1 Uncharacterized protein LHYA1_G006167 [Lachnellula hyalina]
MKIAIFSVVALAALVSGLLPQKSVIITYPDATPNDIIDSAKSTIKDAGGTITHEYKLIKGFAAKVPASALETFTTSSKEYHAVIEEDQMVSING